MCVTRSHKSTRYFQARELPNAQEQRQAWTLTDEPVSYGKINAYQNNASRRTMQQNGDEMFGNLIKWLQSRLKFYVEITTCLEEKQ